MNILAIIFIVISGAFASIGSLLLKKVVGFKKHISISILKEKTMVFSLSFFLMAVFFLILAFKFGELSKVIPFISLTYIWVAILGVKYMNERMNKFRLLGVVFIILGILMVLQ